MNAGAAFIEVDEKERWWRSLWTGLKEIQRELDLPASVIVKDDTLREGILAPGTTGKGRWGFRQRVELGKMLVVAGVTEAEVGYSVRRSETEEVTRLLRSGVPNLKLSIHTQMWGEWPVIEQAIEWVSVLKADRCNLLLLKDESWEDPLACAEKVRRSVRLSRALGVPASFGTIQLLMRPELYRSLVIAALEEGADRIVIYDGHGCAFPSLMRYCARLVRELSPSVDIEVHCHNDLGLGAACTLGAVEGGANVVDVSVNGLGNRAGIAPLEEVVLALEVLYDIRTGINLQELTNLSKFVERESGVEMQSHKPVVGRHIGVHESAVHIEQIVAGSKSEWEVFAPAIVGQSSRLVFGGTSLENDYRALDLFMKSQGCNLNQVELDRLALEIKHQLEAKSYLTEEEVVSLWHEMSQKR